MPNSIPWVLEVSIRVVFNPGLAHRPEVFAQFLARYVEQWTNDFSSLRVHPGETGHASASNQLQQKRLGLIVPCVANGQPIRPNRDRAAVQTLVAEPSGCIFQGQPLRRGVGPHVHRLHRDWQIESHGELAAELLVATGAGSELMIDVSQTHEAEAAVLGQLAEEKCQRH
jgi:hypothetical protein